MECGLGGFAVVHGLLELGPAGLEQIIVYNVMESSSMGGASAVAGRYVDLY